MLRTALNRRATIRTQKTLRSKLGTLVVLTLSLGLAVTGCSADPTPEGTQSANSESVETLLTEHKLNGLEAKEIVNTLDKMPVADRPTNLMASVRPSGLIVSDGADVSGTLPLPTEEFYVSVAPYISQTHECHFHSLTTCRGELSKQPIHITITNLDTGEALVDEDTTTFDNGFIGYWIPKDIKASITITAQNKSATTQIATASEEDATCVTTMQLT